MGTDICQYGNHKIEFTNRSYEEIAQEIKSKLDNCQLSNAEYLKFLEISYLEDSLTYVSKSLVEDFLERIKKYKTQTNWNWNYYLLNEYDYEDEEEIEKDDFYYGIEFLGFLDFNISFTPSSILFFDPHYRYKEWFECAKELRDEWRRYMYQIIKLFNGNRVIYLPDQGADHFLDMFDQLPSLSFEEVENAIIKEYGEVEKEFEKYRENGYTSYYIDNFNDLELSNKLSLDEYIKWYRRT